MRKRIVRKGLKFILAALLLIVVISYYHVGVARFLLLTVKGENNLYSIGILFAAALGGYGVVQAVFGFVLPGDIRDTGVRLMPFFILIAAAFMLFFFLLIASLKESSKPGNVHPGDTITI